MRKNLSLVLLLLALLLLASCKTSYNANMALASGDYERAVKVYRQAIESDPESITLWNKLGRVYFEQQAYAEAADAFAHTLTISPEDANASFYHALALIGAGDRDKGFAELASFRSPGEIYVTNAVRSQAKLIQPKTELTSGDIIRAMRRALKDGIAEQADMDHTILRFTDDN